MDIFIQYARRRRRRWRSTTPACRCRSPRPERDRRDRRRRHRRHREPRGVVPALRRRRTSGACRPSSSRGSSRTWRPGHIAMRFGARGPNYATDQRLRLGRARHRRGAASSSATAARTSMLAGGAEAPVCLLGVGGFSAMRALATGFNDEPERASRPFDARREGFVIARGRRRSSCSRSSSTRRRAARASTPRWSATAPTATPTT